MFLTDWLNKYKYKVYKAQVLLLLTLAVIVSLSCNNENKTRQIETAFYYWKSDFRLSGFEKLRLDSLHAATLYIKFFDVDWDDVSNQPVPKAKVSFKDSSYKGFAIIPTIFITNECIQKIDSTQVIPLAEKTTALIRQIISANTFKSIAEIQFDCDWTASTRSKYFLFLHAIKKLQPGIPVSATIRLHQIKYSGKTGIPPVDRGLLMCYNMGNLKNPATKNSILETTELQKYTGTLSSYPLPLDIGLPLFSWQVLFRNNNYVGLIENLPDSILQSGLFEKKGNQYHLLQDSFEAGYALQKDDILRDEQSDFKEILRIAEIISSKLKNTPCRVSFYHLDSVILKKYSLHELETVVNSLR
jgi:hypothetical protein